VSLFDDDFDDFDLKAISTTCHCLADEVKYNILVEETMVGL